MLYVVDYSVCCSMTHLCASALHRIVCFACAELQAHGFTGQMEFYTRLALCSHAQACLPQACHADLDNSLSDKLFSLPWHAQACLPQACHAAPAHQLLLCTKPDVFWYVLQFATAPEEPHTGRRLAYSPGQGAAQAAGAASPHGLRWGQCSAATAVWTALVSVIPLPMVLLVLPFSCLTISLNWHCFPKTLPACLHVGQQPSSLPV